MVCILLIKEKYKSCLTDNCVKNKCKIFLGNLRDYAVIIDGDLYKENFNMTDKICDCFIFYHDNAKIIVGIIECKGRNVKTSLVEEQLNKSAEIVQKILVEVGIRESQVLPIILSKAISSIDRRNLAKKRVKYRGKDIPIVRQNCECNFENVINM